MWFKSADKNLLKKSIKQFEELHDKLKVLSKQVYMVQGGTYNQLKKILDDRFVKSHKNIYNRLQAAIKGENNQNISLDAPHKVADILKDTMKLIELKLAKEERKLRIEEDENEE